MANFVIVALYMVGLGLQLALVRRSWDKPLTLCAMLGWASWLIYGLVSRVYRIVADTDNVSGTIFNGTAVALFLGAGVLLLLYTLRLDRKIQRGENFTGPDGRPWVTREARLPEGIKTPVTRPTHIMDLQIRAHREAQRAEAEADEVRQPLRVKSS